MVFTNNNIKISQNIRMVVSKKFYILPGLNKVPAKLLDVDSCMCNPQDTFFIKHEKINFCHFPAKLLTVNQEESNETFVFIYNSSNRYMRLARCSVLASIVKVEDELLDLSMLKNDFKFPSLGKVSLF